MGLMQPISATSHPYANGSYKQMLIDGKWFDAQSGKKFETHNPATGELLATVAEGDTKDIDLAVAAARRAFEGPWSKAKPFERQALLRKRFLRLTDQRIFGTALIDRDRNLRDASGGQAARRGDRLVPALLDAGLERHRREQRAFVDLHIQEADIDAVHRRGDIRVFDKREIDRGRQRSRQETIDGRAGLQVAWLVADDSAEVRTRGGEVRFGRQQLRTASGELRFRLGDVRAGHFADIEAITRLLQGLLQHANVALLHFDHGRVAQVIHVDGCGRQHHGLLEHAKTFA